MNKPIKIGVAVLALICTAAVFYLKDSMIGQFLMIASMPGPDHSFTASHASEALDYSLESSWIAHPNVVDNADWTPEGDRLASNDGNQAYVFFIHPTAYLGNEHWNGTFDRNTATEENRQFAVTNQATAYNGCCRVYSPYYREVSISAYFETDLNISEKAIDFAYRDVARAFERFLQEIPAGSPFILASHSQGTLHGQRLLQQVIDATALRERLVAAYLVGGTIHEHLFSSHYKSIGICQTATDLHCAIGFDSWRLGVQPDSSVPNWTGDRYERNDDRWLCVNPLSWKYDQEPVSALENPGSVPIQNDYILYSYGGDVPAGLTWGPLDSPIPGIASAQCSDGILRTNNQDGGPFDGKSWGGNYHSLDYALFYESIRENVKLRVNTWWDQQRSRSQSRMNSGADG